MWIILAKVAPWQHLYKTYIVNLILLVIWLNCCYDFLNTYAGICFSGFKWLCGWTTLCFAEHTGHSSSEWPVWIWCCQHLPLSVWNGFCLSSIQLHSVSYIHSVCLLCACVYVSVFCTCTWHAHVHIWTWSLHTCMCTLHMPQGSNTEISTKKNEVCFWSCR